jgi:hypothetical protein
MRSEFAVLREIVQQLLRDTSSALTHETCEKHDENDTM